MTLETYIYDYIQICTHDRGAEKFTFLHGLVSGSSSQFYEGGFYENSI